MDLSNFHVDNAVIEAGDNYLRYRFTDNGISPRGVPGLGTGFVRVDSDEHDENGEISEDLDGIRVEMVRKRLFKKMESIMASVEPPSIVGSENATNLVICWGSNYHIVREALEQLHCEDIAMVHFHQIYPLHPSVQSLLSSADKVFILENRCDRPTG